MSFFTNFAIYVLLYCNFASAQFAKCAAREVCVLIAECPTVLKLARTNTQESNRRVRNLICGFQTRNTKVCCEVRQEPPAPLLSKESLLPKECGMPMAIIDKIGGGSPAPIGGYPWMAALGYKGVASEGEGKPEFICAGSVINSRYILTAAHCLDPRKLGRRKLSVINLGDWDVSTDEDCQTIEVRTVISKRCAPPHIAAGYEELIIHPQYSIEDLTNDIGLIRLNISIDFGTTKAYVVPICLPLKGMKSDDIALKQQLLTAAGWGLTERGSQSDILLTTRMSFAENNICHDMYPTFQPENQFCIGGMGGNDTCGGDSGGPMIVSGKFGPPFFQVGIVAYSINICSLADAPGVYTAVVEYRDWILANLKP